MELLPRSSQEFASAQYWERFFRRRGPRSFEWYGGYTELCGVLHKYIKPRDKVLVIGCGNSELSEQMYDVGYEDLVNIDISEVVIKQMTERNAARRPKMAFQHMDMMAMHFSDSHFQVVLDKGTLDAVLTDEDEKTLKRVDQMFAEVCRVLPIGGRYICVSLAQDHILKKAVGYFCQEGWMVRVHQIGEHEGKYSAEPDAQFFMPVFVFVMTKFKKIPGSTLRILEICPNEQDKPLRMEDEGQLTEAVRERQRYALLRHQLSRSSATGDISLDLCDKESGKARYTFYIVDSPTVRAANSNHFAAFIIPQGRETEWLFGTEEGRKQLAGSAGYRRLIVVALHRDQLYHGMEGIQSELSTKVLELAPKGLPDNHQIPFLSASNDLGVRTVQHRGTSKQSGEYVIEDVKGDGPSFFRRLVFLTNRNVVQSEARLVPDTPCKGDTSYNVIMFDVDSKDLSLGMSCPPPAFVEKDFLQQVSQVLAPEGIFILNLVCRDTQLKKLVLNVLREVFPLIYTRRIEEEVNEILFCRRQGELKLSPSELQEQAAALESQLKRPNVAWDLTYVLSDMLKGVQIV
ncbi:eEF1A lysine and N-terminal methyltransferase isoform X2 [Ambystoma mexicanum]|uniref:eEF1A lysine and N-terminal methyltransferase isoform X2 n=1 Tax=Ambystoma mexicanum TaxID=8296 RepID=UPI0037E7E5EC